VQFFLYKRKPKEILNPNLIPSHRTETVDNRYNKKRYKQNKIKQNEFLEPVKVIDPGEVGQEVAVGILSISSVVIDGLIQVDLHWVLL